MLSGCLSPVTLTQAVIVYDDAITESQSKQLLVNIARAQHHQPIHFTGGSNVAATFDFRFTAGATPALTGDATILPVIGGSVAENPTIQYRSDRRGRLYQAFAHTVSRIKADVAPTTGGGYRSTCQRRDV